MTDDELLDEFWDASIDGQEIDHESFLAKGGKEVGKAVDIHKLLEKAAETWGQPTPPRQLGRFEIQGDLGAGGIGRVYLGWDPELRRHVAIKVIARDKWAVNEARSIARLDHRAVVKVYEVGHDRVVMELLDGGTLADKIDEIREGTATSLVTIKSRLTCLARLAEGLGYCHQRGILHRDVKPANVLFAKDDDYPRLVDFGLAHIDSEESLDITQNLVGTPSYMAPEQVESGETGSDSRSDIFSFGILAHELLTLDSPFRRDTRTRTLEAIRHAQTRRITELAPDVPMPVEHIVRHCLEADPNERYQTMEEVARDLHNALANRPISVGGRSLAHRAKLLFRRNRQVAIVGTVGVVLTVVVSIGLWVNGLHSERKQFHEELDRLSDDVEASAAPFEFLGTGLRISTAQGTSKFFARHKLGSLLFGQSTHRVSEIADAWTRRLGPTIRSRADFAMDDVPDDGWKSVLQIDEFINPTSRENDDLRNRGKILLADGLRENPNFRVLRQVERGPGPEGAYKIHVEIDFQPTLRFGSYLFQVPGEWTREVLVDSVWSAPIIIQPIERPLAVDGWIEGPNREYLMSPIITIEQALAVIDEKHLRTESTNLQLNDPAECTLVQAAEFAAWAGGRIPLATEVDHALLSRGIPDSPYLMGEYVSDIPVSKNLMSASSVIYAQWASFPEGPPNIWCDAQLERAYETHGSGTLNEKPIRLYYGFRVVYDMSHYE